MKYAQNPIRFTSISQAENDQNSLILVFLRKRRCVQLLRLVVIIAIFAFLVKIWTSKPESKIEPINIHPDYVFFEVIDSEWEKQVREFTKTSLTASNFSASSLERPLIVYSYFETPNARVNFIFFIRHGFHSSADFIFIIMGETNVTYLLPLDAPNIKVIKKDNTCFDLGSIGQVLLSHDEELTKKYKKFILMNASIRGPFLPAWSNDCWSDLFLNRITDEVKLIGLTFNCIPTKHVQSMLLATDNIGINILLGKYATSNETYAKGISTCFENKIDAIWTEIRLSELFEKATYKFEVMMIAAHSFPDYYHNCSHEDVNWKDQYYGFDIHPYETIFIKANRNINIPYLSKLTEWHNSWGYSSWKTCASQK